MHPLPIVSLIHWSVSVLFVYADPGKSLADWLAEYRLSTPKHDALQLNLDSLIHELTIYA